jgi:transcriptional regulator of acetoin/glycerol metabolism
MENDDEYASIADMLTQQFLNDEISYEEARERYLRYYLRPPQIIVVYGTLLEDNERATVLYALRASDWNVKEAARMLGIGKATLYRKIKNWKISLE